MTNLVCEKNLRKFAKALCVISSLAIVIGCTTSMANRLTDQQICYRTRVFIDGWQLGFRAQGETHIGPYANFNAIQREIQLTMRDRPELFDPNSEINCERRFPEVNAPLPQFVQAAEGVIPIPNFYRTIIAGGNPHIPYSGPAGPGSVLILGLIAAAATGGLTAPAAAPPQIIPLAGGELLVLP